MRWLGARLLVAGAWAAGVAGCGAFKATVGYTDGGARDVTTCAPTMEVCNGRDDDCDGVIDQGGVCRDAEVPDALDASVPDEGGGCMTDGDCGAAARCVSGTCVPDTLMCAAGTADCDGNRANGCETNVLSSASSCGACGVVCAAGRSCAMGACVALDACAPAMEVCNGVDDDCDGNVDNGLGTSTCGVGACQRTTPLCVMGTVQSCVPGTPTTEVCNGRDDDCNGMVDEGAACADSGVPACAAGTGDCDGLAANGCEASLASDRNNCGACGVACPAGQMCGAGVCH